MSGRPDILLNSLYAVEPVLMAVVLFAILRSKGRRRFSALIVYLALRLVSFFVLEVVLLHGGSLFHVSKKAAYVCYFYSYWAFYIAGAIAVFFIILELFKSALEPLPGLKRLGSVAFRWIACVSCLAAIASAIVPGVRDQMLLAACDQLMRCESIFLLSLLFFLMLAAGKLGLSYRSRVFGVSFGFGIMAASNLIVSALLFNFDTHKVHVATSAISVMDTGASILTLIVWSAYFFRQEPVRHSIAQPNISSLGRWNEIALVLSPNAGRMAVTASSSDFFLQDVEKVVDRILSKNSLNAVG